MALTLLIGGREGREADINWMVVKGLIILPDINFALVENIAGGEMISHFIKGILFVLVSLAPLYPFVPCNHSYAATHAYLSNSYDNTVSVIQTSDNTVTTTVDVGEWPYGVAVSPDGEYIYVANGGDDTVSIIRTSDNTVTASITVGAHPEVLR